MGVFSCFWLDKNQRNNFDNSIQTAKFVVIAKIL